MKLSGYTQLNKFITKWEDCYITTRTYNDKTYINGFGVSHFKKNKLFFILLGDIYKGEINLTKIHFIENIDSQPMKYTGNILNNKIIFERDVNNGVSGELIMSY